MISLNKLNGAEKATLAYVKGLASLNSVMPIIGVEMGIAYGGGVEKAGQILKGKGVMYGYDTFTGHPKHLAKDPKSLEATCMDDWYKKEVYGMDKLSYEYIRKELDKKGLDNVILVKGEVTKDSCKNLPYVNYALLDMDMLESMSVGYEAVKNKMKPGFVMFLHDVTPPHHLPRLFHWYDDIVLGRDGDMWQPIGQWPGNYLVALKRL
jgi:hypothetical protein